MKPLFLALSLCLCNAAVFAVPPARVPSVTDMNTAFGIPLWQDESLWDDADTAAAARLHWPQQSRTATQSSFRLYADKEARALGCRPYSLAFWAAKNKPTEFSIVFANKGDLSSAADMERDAEAIEKTLRAALGEPVAARFGQSSETRTKARRWNWKGHAILLEAPRDNYVGVRIVPEPVADKEGRAERISDADVRQALAQRVKRRDNGDVIVTEIPMVDQGPKGYCTPATWERYLRYLGIPADMYVLAMAGQTQAGGGTCVHVLAQSAESLITRSGRRLTHVEADMRAMSLGRHIDKGLPLIWSMFESSERQKEMFERAAERRKVTDWNAWNERLKPIRKSARQIATAGMTGHSCLITGYNARTKEVATSHSWGADADECWLTFEEAAAVAIPDGLWEVKW